jgi:hypothetical protein
MTFSKRDIIAEPHGYIYAIFGLEVSHPGPRLANEDHCSQKPLSTAEGRGMAGSSSAMSATLS